METLYFKSRKVTMKKRSRIPILFLCLVFLFASYQPVSAGSVKRYSKQQKVLVKVPRDSENTIRPVPIADDEPINPAIKRGNGSTDKSKRHHNPGRTGKKKVRRR